MYENTFLFNFSVFNANVRVLGVRPAKVNGRVKVYLQTYLETNFEKVTLFTLPFGENVVD